ncbi:MAG: hypothetical protein R3A12_02545 [Ignavibacteria bacterium]
MNLSILDGWWDEAYMPENGWKIDSVMDDSVSQEDKDKLEAMSLYDTLEKEIIPSLFKEQ